MTEIIRVKNLTKKYGDFIAVDNISFSVKTGETFGILGPNGAGKTTTLEMIEGLKSLNAGEIYLDEKNVQEKPHEVKAVIGVQLQASSFFDGLNLKELLETFAALYDRKVDALGLLKSVELDDKWKSQVKQLSGGQKQRLSIAVGLVNDPKVLFLDEPTTGLDPQARRNMWDLITKIKKQGKTIVLTTHYMEEAEVLCDRIAIMDHAKIMVLDTPINLLRNAGVGTSITFRVDKQCTVEHFQKLPAVEKAVQEDHGYRLISSNPELTLPALFKHESDCSFRLFDLQLQQATLEDVFLKLTGKKLRE
ncbi:ABC transporter ATP-binding protein [Candidatus Parcubacteria bacterium]|jgi:ABC-2 type transport system ATP-binding protein|nr:MAG: ABC transporter ATP-binding protein [Candidatus Parcubacteria bacterium]